MAQKISFYFDEHMPRAVAQGLMSRDLQVIMAIDVGMEGKSDDEHLRYATEHETVLVTRDKPFAGRTLLHTDHTGLICWTGEKDIGGMVRRLSEFAEQYTSEQVKRQVFWLKA
jgi:predicted nuclease of predicted toxin-antitoxin system